MKHSLFLADVKPSGCDRAGYGVADPAGVPGAESLPCLSSNNCIESLKELSKGLSPYHKKQAEALSNNVKRLVDLAGIDKVGFLTLTFEDNVMDNKEASRRFNSFRTNFLSSYPHFRNWISVKERQRRGAWHYHLIIELDCDIRTGVNFEEFEQKFYRSASNTLRDIWADLRKAMPKYRFGRHNLEPIKSSSEAMGKYVGKYISKHMGCRKEDDKGVRLMSFSQGWVRDTTNFQWNNHNTKIWRRNLGLFCSYVFDVDLENCNSSFVTDMLPLHFGKKWAYHLSGVIHNIAFYLDVRSTIAYRKAREWYLSLIHPSILEEYFGKFWEVILCQDIVEYEMPVSVECSLPF